MRIVAIACLFATLICGCESTLASFANHAANPSNNPNSPEYQHARENDRRIAEAERDYYRNRQDDSPTYVMP